MKIFVKNLKVTAETLLNEIFEKSIKQRVRGKFQKWPYGCPYSF